MFNKACFTRLFLLFLLSTVTEQVETVVKTHITIGCGGAFFSVVAGSLYGGWTQYIDRDDYYYYCSGPCSGNLLQSDGYITYNTQQTLDMALFFSVFRKDAQFVEMVVACIPVLPISYGTTCNPTNQDIFYKPLIVEEMYFFRLQNGITCVVCPFGYQRVDLSCQACASGIGYVPGPPNTNFDGVCATCSSGDRPDYFTGTCKSCPAGSQWLNNKCRLCSAGYYSSSINSNDCLACEAGKFGVNTGQTQCTPCDYETYQSLPAQSSCAPCGTGYYTPLRGAVICEVCSNNNIIDINRPASKQVFCQGCAPGQFSATGYPPCNDCISGKYNTAPKSMGCISCVQPYYNSDMAATACKLCPLGTQWLNVQTCTICWSGYYRNVESMLTCEPCNNGTYGSSLVNNIDSRKQCQDCPVGTYSCDYIGGNVQCLLCPAGKYGIYARAMTSKLCFDCPTGTYSTGLGMASKATCQSCPWGFFASSAGSTKCTACSVGTYQRYTGTSFCELCSTGFYMDTTGGNECKACSPGYYSDKPGNSACAICGFGLYAPKPAMAKCLMCPPGTWGMLLVSTREEECMLAFAGTYLTGWGSNQQDATSSANKCQVGTYSDMGRDRCEACESGKFASAVGSPICTICNAGYYAKTTSLCDKCPLGTYNEGNIPSTSCLSCDAGKYAPVLGMVACLSCPATKYAANKGMNACLKCPAGQYGVAEGAIVCETCKAGTYSSADGSDKCTLVNAGRYTAVDSATAEILCPRGTFSNESGATECTSCEIDMYNPNEGSTACTPCSACSEKAVMVSGCVNGSIANDRVCHCIIGHSGDGYICTECAIGSAKSTQGNGPCTTCAAGSYADTTGMAVCASCPEGTYSTITGAVSSNVCQECATGKYSAANNPTECTGCPVGTYTNSDGTCMPCAKGKYTSAPGLTQCNQCEKGKYSNTEKSAACVDCAAGTYNTGSGMLQCVQCEIGTYQDITGASVCKSCTLSCANNTYMKSLCGLGATSDTSVCTNVKICPDGFIPGRLAIPGNSTSLGKDLMCKRSPRCDTGYYVSQPSSENNPQVCSKCTLCPNGYIRPCNNTADSICRYYAQCRQPNNLKVYDWLPLKYPNWKCKPGEYLSSITNMAPVCVACPSYLIGSNGYYCEPCKGYRVVSNGNCVCTYPTSANSDGKCVCPIGHEVGANGCSLCPANTIKTTVTVLEDDWWEQKTSCTACPAGTIANSARTQCIPCAEFQYRVSTSTGGCVTCSNGFYAKDPTLSTCSTCSTTCVAGEYSKTCPSDSSKLACLTCTSKPTQSTWKILVPNVYKCDFECNSGYYKSAWDTCTQCSTPPASCPNGKLLEACTPTTNSACTKDCVNATKPFLNSVWTAGCNWECATGYQLQTRNVITYTYYECN